MRKSRMAHHGKCSHKVSIRELTVQNKVIKINIVRGGRVMATIVAREKQYGFIPILRGKFAEQFEKEAENPNTEAFLRLLNRANKKIKSGEIIFNVKDDDTI